MIANTKTTVKAGTTMSQEFFGNAPYLRVREVALVMRVSVRTVRLWIKEGKLPATTVNKQYRVSRDELKEFIERDRKHG